MYKKQALYTMNACNFVTIEEAAVNDCDVRIVYFPGNNRDVVE